MISGLFKAFGQLSDPRLRRIIRFGILGALGAYAGLVATVWIVLSQVTLFAEAWADLGSDLAIGLAALVLPILVFPAVVTTIMGAKLDDVADAVESRHYPHLPPARAIGLAESLRTTLAFLAVMAAANLVALPLYLVLLFTGLTVVLALVLNGYLLGREYYEMVALRRADSKAVRLAWRQNLGQLWLAGMAIAFIFSIPVLNWLGPVIGTAYMAHVAQSLRTQPKSL